MDGSSLNPNNVQFGTFEVDLQARELRKSGIKIKLNDQPFQVLSLLLERPGEVVTREELQTRLWPADTFVDFDLSLNSAVKKLRQALGDESDNPRFVETLYRRGYRFIAPVNRVRTNHSSGGETPIDPRPVPVSTISCIDESSSPQASEYPTVASTSDVKIPNRSTTRFAVIAAACLAILIVGLLFVLIPRAEPRIVGFTQITSGGKVHDMSTLLTDGRRLYFQAVDQSRMALAQVSVNGGESALIPTPFLNVLLSDIAPDGSSILIASFDSSDSFKKAPLWILPLPAGSARPVAVWGAPAIWSPDGHRLLLADDKNLFESTLDGSDTRKLATLSARVSDQRISPDGRKIRLVVNDLATNSNELWEMNRDGSHPHPLLPNWNDSPHECCGRWTQDGKYFVFSSFRNGRWSLWALPEGNWFQPKSKPIQLTNGPLDFYIPLPSKDGKKIFALGGLPRSEVLRFDGKSFVPFFNSVSASDLAFSADGKRVAYVSIPEQILWSSKTDGTDRIQLSDSAAGVIEAALPRWSPDGRQIVFMGRTENADWRAFLVNADGQGFRELIPGAPVGFDPGWSPDGKSIVLAVGDLGATSNKISILDLATGKLSPVPGGENLFSPRWSPDGRYLAAMTTDSTKLMLFDWTSRQWSELAQMGVGYPSWSHDSRYIYFDAIFRQDPAFFRVRLSDRKLESLASLKEIHRLWGVHAEWSGLGPDDSLLITRDISSPEIYALDWQP